MATLMEIYNLLTDEGEALRARCMAATMIAARSAIVESPATVNHTNRVAWGQHTLFSRANLQAMSEKTFTGLCSDPSIQDLGNNATDTQIQTTVDSLVDYFANELATP